MILCKAVQPKEKIGCLYPFPFRYVTMYSIIGIALSVKGYFGYITLNTNL